MASSFPFRSLESTRRRSSRLLAIALQAQAIVAGVSLGVLASVPLGGPFSLGLIASGVVLLAVLSSFAAMEEWNRDRLGESFSLAAAALGFGLSLVVGLAGLWFVAPLMALASFAVGFALAERYMTRNEDAHRPTQ